MEYGQYLEMKRKTSHMSDWFEIVSNCKGGKNAQRF